MVRSRVRDHPVEIGKVAACDPEVTVLEFSDCLEVRLLLESAAAGSAIIVRVGSAPVS
jgi:hypothetical protein